MLKLFHILGGCDSWSCLCIHWVINRWWTPWQILIVGQRSIQWLLAHHLIISQQHPIIWKSISKLENHVRHQTCQLIIDNRRWWINSPWIMVNSQSTAMAWPLSWPRRLVHPMVRLGAHASDVGCSHASLLHLDAKLVTLSFNNKILLDSWGFSKSWLFIWLVPNCSKKLLFRSPYADFFCPFARIQKPTNGGCTFFVVNSLASTGHAEALCAKVFCLGNFSRVFCAPFANFSWILPI